MQATVHPFNRSSISNGRRLHRPGAVDGRTHAGRRWRDIYLGFKAELGHAPGMAEDSLLRSVATVALRSETLAAELAAGRKVDDGELNRLTFSLRRVLTTLGLTGRANAETEADRLRMEQEDREAGLIP